MAYFPQTIASLDALDRRYRALLCDVWGVLHNGEAAFADAVHALVAARAKGLAVVLITNSPRPHKGVEAQLRGLGVPDEAWDRVVTSGDVTRDLIAAGPRRVFHLGPERDYPIFDGLDVELVEDFEADAVVCTGLFDDENETPQDYVELLTRLRARNLPFVCANPDVMVERGDRFIWCAGALARDFAQLGGRTLIAGKPHPPIYEATMQAVASVLGGEVARGEVLAIGDGMMTDIKGAADNGIDSLYVSGGVHAREHGDALDPDAGKLAAFLEKHGYRPVATMPKLR